MQDADAEVETTFPDSVYDFWNEAGASGLDTAPAVVKPRREHVFNSS